MVVVPVMAGMKYIENTLFVTAFFGVFSVVIIVIAFTIKRAYGMKFSLTKDRLVIHGIFKKNVIKRSDIVSVEKVPIPFGFRLFGASFLGGWYYLPGIGKAWVTMGNFRDGVLITTREKSHYVITPRNPMEFIRKLKA